jgi:hypothetical protein
VKHIATARYPGEIWELPNGQRLGAVHLRGDCATDRCVFHKPSEHSMSEFKLHWRDDRGIFERICPHGVGHPDPDQFPYWELTDDMAQAVHGCDGCCGPAPSEADWEWSYAYE